MKWAQNSDSKTSKKELLEQISAKNPYVTFFLGHPVDRHVDGIFFGEPLAIEEQTVLFPSSCKRVGAERFGG